MSAPLLLEIGCEEIPARMIADAAAEIARRVAGILDGAGIPHGLVTGWGGTRRLAVLAGDVGEREPDRTERVLGPAARAAFGADGAPTPAALGFARKQGVDPSALRRVATDKGEYVAIDRRAAGRSLEEVLADALPAAVASMSFPKTMRWGDGRHRWVRPVHWIVALHGSDTIRLEIFGVGSGSASRGHRFLAPGPVEVGDAARYSAVLERARVVVDPGDRRRLLSRRLAEAAAAAGGQLLDDALLLEEVVDLVEWPGVVVGGFDPGYLDLPREILVTTLRHHQKSFSVQVSGRLLPLFLSVSNTDRDPAGHIRRGNEWVVGGRLEDARFFWTEDRKAPLETRLPALSGVVFHKKAGTYGDKSQRLAAMARTLASRLGFDDDLTAICARAAALAKADLVTGLVGEFPELQGIVGGLLLRGENADERLAQAVYEHYRPAAADDPTPSTVAGRIVALADKLDSVASLVGAGEKPTGSRDPFGLRRAANGLFRIVLESDWALSIRDLTAIATSGAGAHGAEGAVTSFLESRIQEFLRDRGASANEVRAVFLAGEGRAAAGWAIPEIASRLAALRTVRDRDDFRQLVDLVRRVDNIHGKAAAVVAAPADGDPAWREEAPAAVELDALLRECAPWMARCAEERRFEDAVETLARFLRPVERFFDQVLVIDPGKPSAMRSRLDLLARTRSLLTLHFDIRELSGQAGGRP